MKRYVCFLALSAALILLCTSPSLAMFPGRDFGTNPFPGSCQGFNNRVGDGLVWVQLQRGWALGVQAWYACFATNNLRMAQTQSVTLVPYCNGPTYLPPSLTGFEQSLTLSPKLTSAIGNGAQPMYVVTNFNNNGPVFSTSPLTTAPYTGLWEVVYVTWLPGVTPWVITDTTAPAGSAPGLPIAGVQATFSSQAPGTPPSPFAVATVLDCPIFAVGVISNPWFKPIDCPPPPIVYRIPQGVYLDYQRKLLAIPYWNVWCQDEITHRKTVQRVVIPDVSDPTIAFMIGANYAPTLANVPIADRSNIFIFSWLQDLNCDPNVFQPLKVLVDQYPVLDACPSSCEKCVGTDRMIPANFNPNNTFYNVCPRDCGWRNTNFDYSPIFSFILLEKDLGLISPEVLFDDVPFLLQQIDREALIPVPPYGYPAEPSQAAFNAPVVCVPPIVKRVDGGDR
jgi:hypothetical protein